MSLWHQSGLSLDVALRAAVSSSLAITGIVDVELLLLGMQRPEGAALTWVPNARRAFNLERDPDADFELVVRSLLDGVYARLAAADARATA